MMLKASLVLLASAATVLGAAVVGRDQIASQTCIQAEKYVGINDNNYYSLACYSLESNCLKTLNATSTDLWSVASCVAGATCAHSNLLTLAQCANSAVSKADAPHLNYDIYASIVGDCAWDEGGCPITQQNYIDFFYGTLSAIGSANWPSSADDVVTYYWDPINAWTATGETIPYTNFDDWLHYA